MTIILMFFLSYLLGSVPFALIVGKTFYGTDVRMHGSGNLGATNTFRVLGKKAGIFVSLGDVSKGALATSLPFIFHSNINPLLVGLAAIAGHCYPVFAGFKGGKAVATTAGVFLFVEPLAFLIGAICFFATLKFSKYASLSSIIAVLGITLFSFTQKDFLFSVVCLGISFFIVFKHKKNIVRIKNKQEPKVKWI